MRLEDTPAFKMLVTSVVKLRAKADKAIARAAAKTCGKDLRTRRTEMNEADRRMPKTPEEALIQFRTAAVDLLVARLSARRKQVTTAIKNAFEHGATLRITAEVKQSREDIELAISWQGDDVFEPFDEIEDPFRGPLLFMEKQAN